MKILIASDSFKGCMSTWEANLQMERGVRRADPSIETEMYPISDGGEGLVDAFASVFSAEMHSTMTRDLYGHGIQARWAYDAKTKTACVEAASVLGLPLYPVSERRPLEASSYGLGLLVKEILHHYDLQRLIIGLGGTGTNDGGIGFAAAFGAVFYDRFRKILRPCAAALSRIAFIDKRNFHPIRRVELIAACDVTCHLLGSQGATSLFGRQKGLLPSQLGAVERGMTLLNDKIDQTFHVNMNAFPGSGAAGGLGGMLIGVFRARMVSGIDILEEGGLREKIRHSDYVFTGEGQTDLQTSCGKAVGRLASIASDYDVPVVCISGAIGLGAEKIYDQGVTAIFSTADRAMSFPNALRLGPEKLEQETFNLTRLITAAQRHGEKEKKEKETGA